MDVKAKLNNIEAICYFPRDFQGARRFFEDVFGFEPKRIQPTVENPNFIEYWFKGCSTIALWERSAVAEIMGEENLMQEAHNFMTAIKVPKVEDVDEIYEEFTRKGVVCISKPHTYEFGSRAAYFLDFERNIWEIFAWVEGGDGPALVERDDA